MSRRRWTLRRKLVVGTGTLVAIGLLVAGILTTVALRSFVYERLDTQVQEELQRAMGPESPGGEDALNQPGSFSDDGPAERVGSLQVFLDEEGSVRESAYVADNGDEVTLTDEQKEILQSTTLTDGVPATVDLGSEIGVFRVVSGTQAGTTVIAGRSVEDVTATTTALAVILLGVSGATLLVILVGLAVVVTRSLRPLSRVAAVADRVATRELADGEVDIPDRVDVGDTDSHTEVGRVGRSLNTLLGHVEAALTSRQHSEEQLRRFIADASHELRTPLASIRGYAQLSQAEAAPMTPTQERSFDRISAESARMADLVDDLLLLARLDAGQSLREDSIDLPLLVIDAVSDAHAADPAREWRLDEVTDEAIASGDENRLRQVLSNLLRNARTHTPPGTVVTTSLSVDDTHAIIRVNDNGTGIDPSVRDRLFERFARGDHSRNRDSGSTGLGLSIAHAIVAAHGGTITVDSEPGNTTFTVRVPLQQARS
ncbi:MAG: HAMP domain-containing sensor histidine kinase [Microbacterium sp.]|uniref:sensor histidine kinase n=1 Tax=Microbacterium sp. TaxID=51671 RepID=UPI0026189F13|nr:HAMP domain-containing sensor histidine kinase [Microbacterium sp.]MCX6500990.1 HAMP domain-containing sensor histidine kinase [Microbacterium sp.]